MQGPFLRKYGVETTIPFTLFEVDGVAFRVDAVAATADTTIQINEATALSCTNLFVDRGTGYSQTLTAAEMTGARIVVYIVDSATKVWLDDSYVVETYGHPSAMHPFDLGTSFGSAATAYGLTTAGTIATQAAVGIAAGTALTSIPWNAAWDAEVESEVVDGIAAGTALTSIPWNAAWDAEVESEVVDGIGAGTGLTIVTDKIDTVQASLDTIGAGTGLTIITGKLTDIDTASAATIVDLMWDEVLSGATHNVPSSAGRRLRAIQDYSDYEDGAVWIDTVNGAAGTTDFENGTVSNPVDSIADALTIAASVGLTRLHIMPNSTVAFAASMDGYHIDAEGATISLGGQSVSGTIIHGATIAGDDDGSNTNPTVYHGCVMTSHTLGLHEMHEAGFGGTITFAEAGTFDYIHCYSLVAGTSTPGIDVGAAVGTCNVNLRLYSGGIEIQNFGQAGTDNMSLEGFGQLVINANCTGGTIAVRGNFTVTDNASGAVTLSDDARIDVAQINAEADTALSDYDGPTKSEMDTAHALLATQANIGIAGSSLTAINLPNQTMDITGNIIGNLSGSVGSVTGHTPQTGDSFARIGAGGSSLTALPGQPYGIEKNAALSNFEFLMVDATDHFTPETGLTVTGNRSIDGGAFASVSGAIAEVSNGIYQFDAAAADTNGDLITWRFSAAGAADTFVTFKTES